MESRTLHSQHLLTRTIGLNANVVVAMASCGGCSALVPVLLAELWPQLNVISQMDAHHAAQAFMLALEGGLSDMEAPWDVFSASVRTHRLFPHSHCNLRFTMTVC